MPLVTGRRCRSRSGWSHREVWERSDSRVRKDWQGDCGICTEDASGLSRRETEREAERVPDSIARTSQPQNKGRPKDGSASDAVRSLSFNLHECRAAFG